MTDSIPTLETFGLVLLSTGHFGVVKQGRIHTSDGDIEVAVKYLKNPDISQLDREATKLWKLRHPNIVTMYGVTSDRTGIIMEYLDGGTLQENLLLLQSTPESERIRNIRNILRVLKEVLDAMCYISSHEYIHCDLAARNILLTSGDLDLTSPKIGDFGHSEGLYGQRYIESLRNTNFPLTSPPEIMETLENLCGAELNTDNYFSTLTEPSKTVKLKIGIKSDVWSFGFLIRECFVFGLDPFIRRNISAVKTMILHERRKPDIPQYHLYPKDLENIAYSCWNFEPEKRPSFDELRSQMETLHSDQLQTLSSDSDYSSFDYPLGHDISDFIERLKNYYRTKYSRVRLLPGVPYSAKSIRDVWIDLKFNIAFSNHSPKSENENYQLQLKSALDQQRLVVISGEPGIGKSTLVKRICFDWSEDRFIEGVDLILVAKLRDKAPSEAVTMLDLAISWTWNDGEQLKQTYRFEDIKTLVAKIPMPRILILIDGLDEDRTGSDLIDKMLETEYSLPHPTVITTRPHRLMSIQSNFQLIQVQGFSVDKQNEFIRNHFAATADFYQPNRGEGNVLDAEPCSDSLIAFLDRKDNSVRQLARIPLLLLMICLNRSSITSPTEKFTTARLYRECIKTLLMNYKGEKTDPVFNSLDDWMESSFIQSMGKLAIGCLMSESNGALVFSKLKCRQFFHSDQQLSLAIELGLITNEGPVLGTTQDDFMLSFPHKSLLEFFAAIDVKHAIDAAAETVETSAGMPKGILEDLMSISTNPENNFERIQNLYNFFLFYFGLVETFYPKVLTSFVDSMRSLCRFYIFGWCTPSVPWTLIRESRNQEEMEDLISDSINDKSASWFSRDIGMSELLCLKRCGRLAKIAQRKLEESQNYGSSFYLFKDSRKNPEIFRSFCSSTDESPPTLCSNSYWYCGRGNNIQDFCEFVNSFVARRNSTISELPAKFFLYVELIGTVTCSEIDWPKFRRELPNVDDALRIEIDVSKMDDVSNADFFDTLWKHTPQSLYIDLKGSICGNSLCHLVKDMPKELQQLSLHHWDLSSISGVADWLKELTVPDLRAWDCILDKKSLSAIMQVMGASGETIAIQGTQSFAQNKELFRLFCRKLKLCKHLRNIYLKHCSLTDYMAELLLGALRAIPKLRSLDLRYNSFSKFAMINLVNFANDYGCESIWIHSKFDGRIGNPENPSF